MFRFPRSRACYFIAGIFLCALIQMSSAQDNDAALGVPSNAPGATLLIPYFEVDLNPEGTRTTLISLRAVSPEPALTHMTIWTDVGVPILSFSIYLTGYDEQSINLRDILVGGNLPQTAPVDFISPQGPYSANPLSFPNCGSLLPPPVLSSLTLSRLTAALTGNVDPTSGICWGSNYGDGVARGYVTVDVVTECAAISPTDPGYFISGGNGIAKNDNVLRGEFMLVDPPGVTQGLSELRFLPAVSLRASSSSALTSTPGTPTFYGFVNNYDASDNREALPSRWRAPIDGPTDLVVWRGPRNPRQPFFCGIDRSDYSFAAETDRIVVSPRGNGETLGASADSPFPLVTQRVRAGGTPNAFFDASFQIKPAGLLFNAEHAGAINSQTDQEYQQALIMSLNTPGGLPVGHYSSNAVPLQSAYEP